MQAITFLGNQPSLKKCSPLKCNIGVNGIIVKCAISSKPLIVKENRYEFVSRGPMCCTGMELFMSDSIGSI